MTWLDVIVTFARMARGLPLSLLAWAVLALLVVLVEHLAHGAPSC